MQNHWQNYACSKVPIFGDSQSTSTSGHLEYLIGYDYLFPNERELRLRFDDFSSSIEALSIQMMTKQKAQNLLVTLGHEGMILYDEVLRLVLQDQYFTHFLSLQ